MTITIPGVPEFLTREQYLALIAGAGFDVDDVIELRFTREGLHAITIARDEAGDRIVVGHGVYAKHRVFIPVRAAVDDDRTTTIRPVRTDL